MKISNVEYAKIVSLNVCKSPKLKDFLAAFAVGGAICALGEILFTAYNMKLEETDSRTAVAVTLVFFSAVLTGLGVFDKIAKFGGAGTLVPITGFANAMVAPAIEFKTEGQIFGIGINMFKIAGPVIVYGIFSATAIGIIYYIIKMFGVTI